MAFVKLDCKILDSTLWLDIEAREIFITALLMAVPWDTQIAMPQLDVNTMKPTGWEVPAGWYGLVPAAGPGIVRRAGLDIKPGMSALVRLGNPERESRSPSYEGRRLVRISGGFVVLNYMLYREKDNSAQRQKLWRERQKNRNAVTPSRNVSHAVTVTEAEAESNNIPLASAALETSIRRSIPDDRAKKNARSSDTDSLLFEQLWAERPKRDGGDPKGRALKAWCARREEGTLAEVMLGGMHRYCSWCNANGKHGTEFVMQTATFLGPDHHFDEPWDIPIENGKGKSKEKKPWKPGVYDSE